MTKSICVFSSSSNAVRPEFFRDASELGAQIGKRGWSMVYGAGCIGLMGESARAVQAHGGEVIGVIPKYLRKDGICYEGSDELIVTEGLRDRKAIMQERSDAFVALPGGFGTLEEVLEIITLKQLGEHNKPVVLLNTEGFWNPLSALFESLFEEHFVKPQFRSLYHIATTAPEALNYIESYHPPEMDGKWF